MTTELEDGQPTFPCHYCSRRFIRSSLEKHEPACKKLTKMQRKVFDSGKQRSLGSDIPLNDIRKAAKEREKILQQGGVFPRPQTHWRERHEEFMGVVSASKQVGQALKTGAPLPPPPKSAAAQRADYVRCQFCGRSFNKNAAERHIDFCKEQNARKATAASRQNSTSASSQTRQQPKSGTSTASSMRNGPAAVPKTSSSSSSSRGSRPTSAGRQRPPSGAAIMVPAQGVLQIGGAAVDVTSKAHHHQQSKLPQPSKRSSSAPRAVATAQNGLGSNGTNSAAPKSAGTGTAKGKMTKTATNSKQRAG